MTRGRKTNGMADSEYVSVNARESSSGSEDAAGQLDDVNGEKVEMEMARERRVQFVRTAVSGVAFMMGVVGVWGDGA